jgi:hypothetical protein
MVESADEAWCEKHGRRECKAHRTDREDCHGIALAGTIPARCRNHAGPPAARAKAAIRVAVAMWGDDMTTLDPATTLLRLMTIAYLRSEQHADELNKILQEHGWLDAFVGEAFASTAEGETYKVGEYARRLAMWEAEERKMAADLAIKAVAAGLEERRVRAEESQVALFAQALDLALEDAGLSERSAEVKSLVARKLRSIAS